MRSVERRASRTVWRASPAPPYRRGLGLVALLSLVLSLAGTVGPAAAAPASRLKIAFYGDSLSYQASPYLASDFDRGTTSISTSHVYPGTALCDWLGSIDALSESTAPAVAVLQFVGNHFTPCISGYSAGSAAFIAKYASDLTSAIDHLRSVGVRDVLVDLGPATDDPGITWYSALRSAYLSVVKSFHTSHVAYAWKADQAVETSAGRFTATLSCLEHEANAGLCKLGTKEQVRSVDGLHFCPSTVGGPDGRATLCPIYSSGAYRFALGLSRTIWHWLPATKPSQSPLADAVSAHSVSATGGTRIKVTGTGFASVRGVAFVLPLPNGGFDIWGGSARRIDDDVVAVTTPNFEKRLKVDVGTVFVSVETASSQSPWGGLTEVEVTF